MVWYCTIVPHGKRNQDYRSRKLTHPSLPLVKVEWHSTSRKQQYRSQKDGEKDMFRFLFWTVPILLWDGLCLVGFVVVLSPGFTRFLWYYTVVSRRVTLRFGEDSCRQSLDIYFPDDASYQKAREYMRQPDETAPTNSQLAALMNGPPTVIFASGGAWLIGYKMWGCLLARALTLRGMVVILPDYRNYPWGTVGSMVDDIDMVLEWTFQNTALYGGNPWKTVLVGQSAGGHLGLVSLLRRAMSQQTEEEETRIDSGITSSWRPRDLCGFISLSGPFHLSDMEQTFRKHGLDASLVDRIFGGQRETYNPWSILQGLSDAQAASLGELLPPIHLYHGSRDRTVPCESSAAFATEFRRRVLSNDNYITWNVYDTWSHTDAILEGPMQGDHRFHDDIVQAVVDWTGFTVHGDQNDDDNDPSRRPLCPKILVRCAKLFMPF
eukprot:scaffold1640_cov161-Amphora_coffeaeformis.AAC.24